MPCALRCAIINHIGHVRVDPHESWVLSHCSITSYWISRFVCRSSSSKKSRGWIRKAHDTERKKRPISDHYKTDHVHTFAFRFWMRYYFVFAFSRACVAQRHLPLPKRLNEYNAVFSYVFVPINRLNSPHEFHWNRNADNYPIRLFSLLLTIEFSQWWNYTARYPNKIWIAFKMYTIWLFRSHWGRRSVECIIPF